MSFFESDPALKKATKQLEIAKARIPQNLQPGRSIVSPILVDKDYLPEVREHTKFCQLFRYLARCLLVDENIQWEANRLASKYFSLFARRVKTIGLLSYKNNIEGVCPRNVELLLKNIVREDKVMSLKLPQVWLPHGKLFRVVQYSKRLVYLALSFTDFEVYESLLGLGAKCKLVVHCTSRTFTDLSETRLIAAIAMRESLLQAIFLKVSFRLRSKLGLRKRYLRHFLARAFKYFDIDNPKDIKFVLLKGPSAIQVQVAAGIAPCELINKIGDSENIEYLH